METTQNNTPALRFPEFIGDWEIKKVANIAEKVNSGKTPLGGESVYTNSGILFIRSQNIKNNILDLEQPTFIPDNINATMKNSIVKAKDILLNITGASLGRSCVVPANFTIGNVNQHVCIIRLKKENDPNFLQPILASQKGQNLFISLQTGSGREGLNFDSIKKIKLSFPSLLEQQKIATFLSAVDEKIQQLKKKKELLEQYKKGLMQQIFSQKIRFKDEKGNEYPDWEEKTLGEIAEYKNGGAFEKQVCENGNYNLISLNSIDINGKLKSEHKKISITDNSLQKGDLVMVLSDVAHGFFLGLTDTIPNDNFVLNQRMGALKPKIKINNFYLKTFINYNQKYFKLKGQGSSQQNLSKGDILAFKVSTPSNDEQEKIADFLSQLDNKIGFIDTQLSQSQNFKKGLLQQMFV